MPSYEYLVKDKIDDRVLGVFDDLNNAMIFVKALFETFYNENNLTLVIVRQELE